jgi:hypothetical protein
MFNRFEDPSENLVEVFIEVMDKWFPTLGQLKFKLVFDLKRRIKQGKICLASTELATDKVRYYTKDDEAVDGYDYVLIFDKKAWDVASPEDKVRLMRHELRHVLIDEKDKLKIAPHDVSDFRIEQKLNEDDPDWGFNLAILVNDMYEQEKEMAKEAKKKNFGG